MRERVCGFATRGAAAVCAVSALSLFAASCGGDEEGSGADRNGRPSWLFVQDVDSGTFTRSGDGDHRLTLRGVDPDVVAFTDRPERETALLSQQEAITAAFGDDPKFADVRKPGNPNAAIEVAAPNGDNDVLAVELSNPRYDADDRTVTYDAAPLKELTTPHLAHYRPQDDQTLPRRFGNASLFIDSARLGDSYRQRCTHTVQNEAYGDLNFQSKSTLGFNHTQWIGQPQSTIREGTGPNPPMGNAGNVETTGTPYGCGASTTWTVQNSNVQPPRKYSGTVTMSGTNPFVGSNSWSCKSSVPGVTCNLVASNSVTHGSAYLELFWLVEGTPTGGSR